VTQQVFAAVRQVAHAGSDAQMQQARTLLGETRRSLYRILAEDDPPGEDTASAQL
jgi:hypothetical protein